MPSMNGVLIIDKPAGLTSHDVVARARRIIGERRIGHTGTLDPFATGVLVLLVGHATRLAQFLSGAEKEYEALIRFGYATDTGDVTGKQTVSESHANAAGRPSLPENEIETAIASLRGGIEQVPPMYSAKKIGGRRLYELARQGVEVERQPVRVNVSEFALLPSHDGAVAPREDGTVDVAVRVVCSAGTYIRAMAEDLGKKLGTGAHLAALRRTRAGRFGISEATTLERLTELAQTNSITDILISPAEALAHLPLVHLDVAEAEQTRRGVDLRTDAFETSGWFRDQPVRMCAHGELIAVGIFDDLRRSLHPRVVLSHPG